MGKILVMAMGFVDHLGHYLLCRTCCKLDLMLQLIKATCTIHLISAETSQEGIKYTTAKE